MVTRTLWQTLKLLWLSFLGLLSPTPKDKSDNSDSDIKNRIIETRKMRLGDVLPNPHNIRKHPSFQKEMAERIIRDELGWAGVPLVYYSEQAQAYVFLDGHMRRDMFPSLFAEVAITDFDDQEAIDFILRFDHLGSLATTDEEKMKAALAQKPDLQPDDTAIQILGDKAKEVLLVEQPISEQPASKPQYHGRLTTPQDVDNHACRCPRCGNEHNRGDTKGNSGGN